MTLPDCVPVVTEPSAEYLNPRQRQDYRAEREECLSWLLAFGKAPDEGEGYALGTVKPRSSRMDQFYRFGWEIEGGYTSNISTEHADAWMRELAQSEASSAHKTNCQKAVKMLFKWRAHERGGEKWDPEISFSDRSGTNPADFLSRDERAQIRDASLEYGSVPSYSNLTPAERDRWKQYLAQRFQKPKSEISQEDWEKAHSWKIPSLVSTTLDAGLRPIEVENAAVSWIDTENSVLRIPKEDSAKSRDNWIVSLRERTATYLERWIAEREHYEDYEGVDTIWLTREANPYSSQSLRYLLHKLCELAGIEVANRQMSWYSIRHSVGTYMTREEDLSAAQSQLRHKSPRTTMKYDQAPPEDRQGALDRMG